MNNNNSPSREDLLARLQAKTGDENSVVIGRMPITYENLTSAAVSQSIHDLIISNPDFYLETMEKLLQDLHGHISETFPHIKFHGVARVKSQYSLTQNLNQHLLTRDKDLLDATGVTIIVDSVESDISPEDFVWYRNRVNS